MRAATLAGAVATLVAMSGTAAAVVPGGGALAPGGSVPDATVERAERAERLASLAGAAGWRDTLEAYRAPARPTPADTESAILVLDGPPASRVPPGERAAAVRSLRSAHAALAQTLESLGATVTFRYSLLVNGLAVRVPAGRLPALARLPEVRSVVPVEYLAPAQSEPPDRQETPEDGSAAAPATSTATASERDADAVRVALIDAGVDATHPWLGSEIGPTSPIVGGADLVDRDGDPQIDAEDPGLEAHGTQVASLLLRDESLATLPPERRPRLLSYRVVAPEPVAGRLRPLARTDRVLAALERAVDPNGDGSSADRADVVLLGLASGFGGGREDPVAAAIAEADRIGALVVVPAGNDGPTHTRPGSVGAPASVPSAVTVGAIAEPLAESSDLELQIGPARPRLAGLPALGGRAGDQPRGVTLLEGSEGPAPGNSAGEYRGPDGESLVEGKLVVVGRGGATIAAKAHHAAEAGAAGLVVWDLAGPPTFPTDLSAPGSPIPVVGVGPEQGQALATLARADPSLTGRLIGATATRGDRAVAVFSSRGPAADGAPKPDVVAPGASLLTAWPREESAGAPTATLSGTSAAAAQVAALAARMATDRPQLGPRALHSLLVQGATPLEGASWSEAGAGEASQPTEEPLVATSPAIVTVDADARRAPVRFLELSGEPGRYEVVLADDPGAGVLARLDLDAGGAASATLRLPEDVAGWLWVRARESGRVAARVPLVRRAPARTPAHALGTPVVSESGGTAVARVRVGLRERKGGRVISARLRDVRLSLRPVGDGDALPLTQQARDAGWPAGTYRILIATRVATGLEVPRGRYRLEATATGADGTRLRTISRPFRIG